jgi:hypothetical protein
MDFLLTVFQTILGFLSLFIWTLLAAVVVCCLAAGCICGRTSLSSAYTVRSASLDTYADSQRKIATDFFSCWKANLQSLFGVFPREQRRAVTVRSHYRESARAGR